MSVLTTIYNSLYVLAAVNFVHCSASEDPENTASKMCSWNKDLSYIEFCNAVTYNGYPCPNHEQYKWFKSGMNSSRISSKREAAMFLAQIIHESGGLQLKEETPNSRRGQQYCPYHGRGYIQLTWDYNYRAASLALYRDDRLIRNPDSVINEKEAWQTSFWFWDTNVHDQPGISGGLFSASSRAINSIEWVQNQPNKEATNRFTKYLNVLRAFGMDTSAAKH